jgi:hypothetical protein
LPTRLGGSWRKLLMPSVRRLVWPWLHHKYSGDLWS